MRCRKRVRGQRLASPIVGRVLRNPLNVLVDDATQDGPALDPLPGEVGDGVVGRGGCNWRLRWGQRPISGQEPEQRGEDRAAGPVRARPATGTAQHGDLAPEGARLYAG